MDNRLILTILFVTLSWMYVGTYAQNSMSAVQNNMINATTAAAGNNVTMAAAGNNATTAAAGNNATTAAAGNNATTAAAGNNATTAAAGNNATTAAAGNNATTAAAGNNATTAAAGNNATTAAAGNNATTAAAGNNATTAAGNNATTAAGNNATAAPPLTPNTTVEALQTPLSRAECGTKQLCAAAPSNCDPSSGSCFFLAARQLSGQNFELGLSGQSQGYIAATLSTDSTLGGNDTTYVCANNNGVVKFFGTVLNDGKLIKQVLKVNSVKGRVNGTTIQCTFAATVPTPATRTTNLVLAISTGAFNSTTETLGNPVPQLRSPFIDLANPNTTVINEITTPNHAIALQQSLTQALLIAVGVLGLAML